MPFILNAPGLNSESSTGHGGPIASVGGDSPETHSGYIYQQFQNPFNTEAIAIAAPTPIDGLISVMVPTSDEGYNTIDVFNVNLKTTEYVPTSSGGGSLEVGTYSFSLSTQELTIKLVGDPPQPNEVIKLTVVRKKKKILSDRYLGPVPQFFKGWNVNGPATFQRQFGSSPSGSISFRMPKGEFEERLCDLKEGTPLEWRGHGYGVASVSSDWLPYQDQSEVSVSFRGPHDHLMDEQVRYRGQVSNGAISDLADEKGLLVAGLNLSGGDSGGQVTIDFATLCRRAGLAYVGPSVSFKISKDRDKRDSTTIQSEMGRALSVEAFAYLSSIDAIEFRTWFEGRKTHNLSVLDILNNDEDKIDIEYNVVGNEWDGIKLATEYKNTQLNLDESEIEGDEVGRTNYRSVRRYGSAVRDTANGKLVITTPPANVDRSTPAGNFDQGGPTKDYIVEVYQNGVLISKSRTVYGYAYKTSEFVTFQNSGSITKSIITPPEQQPRLVGWGVVSEEEEEYEFDGNGYLVRILKTIKGKRRFKQETDQRETVRLHTEANFATSSDATVQANLRAAKQQALALYDFFDVVEYDITEYSLESLEDYYPDLPPLDEGDPDRLFVARIDRSYKVRYESSDLSHIRIDEEGNAVLGSRTFITQGTDASAIVDGLTVSTGVDREETVITDIVYPPKGVSKDRYRKEDDYFTESEEIRTASGENLKNVLKAPPEFRENHGRPNEAKRLEIFEDGDTPTPEEEPETENKILLNTPNNGLDPEIDAIDGSVSFPGATTKAEGLAAAICDISIQNTQSVEVWSNLRVPTNRIYDEGDRVQLLGKTFRILSIEESANIEGKNSIGFPFQVLSIGREIDLRNHVTDTEVE